jgi:hypothetical protein
MSHPVHLILPPSAGRSIRRVVLAVLVIVAAAFITYTLWRPGRDIVDGGNDRGRNGIWLAHGWLGADDWFTTNGKTNEFAKYRSPANVRALAEKLKRLGITDVFPHLCPASPVGQLPAIDPRQTELFLDAFEGLRVMPWIGGPNGSSVRLNDAKWRTGFVADVRKMFATHPRLAGVQVNVEPLPSGDEGFLRFLEEVRTALPTGKVLSVAAYPPPTRWHPFPEVHWEESYFRDVARQCDQLAVMLYDAGQKIPKSYQKLMADWTVEVLAWSEGKAILLGVPTYDDAGVGYHDPKVENLTNALLGIHRGLSQTSPPTNYQGVGIYCDWETSDAEWNYFRDHFLKSAY